MRIGVNRPAVRWVCRPPLRHVLCAQGPTTMGCRPMAYGQRPWETSGHCHEALTTALALCDKRAPSLGTPGEAAPVSRCRAACCALSHRGAHGTDLATPQGSKP